MEDLFSQLSLLADEALNDENFDTSRIEHLLSLFEYEACASWSKAEKEAEDELNSLIDIADVVERRSEEELSVLARAAESAQRMSHALGSAAGRASDKYIDAALASAVDTMKSSFAAAKINKVHPL